MISVAELVIVLELAFSEHGAKPKLHIRPLVLPRHLESDVRKADLYSLVRRHGLIVAEDFLNPHAVASPLKKILHAL